MLPERNIFTASLVNLAACDGPDSHAGRLVTRRAGGEGAGASSRIPKVEIPHQIPYSPPF